MVKLGLLEFPPLCYYFMVNPVKMYITQKKEKVIYRKGNV